MRQVVFAALLALPAALAAQNTPPPAQPCAAPEHRQFDFWVGDWIVEDTAGQRQGENRIEVVLGGCALHESWNGGPTSIGHSYNIWNRNTRRWHQTWVANNGQLLLLDGGLENGAMVLGGRRETPRGTVWDRITWRPLAGGVVQQLWEISTDSARTWRTFFDGRYRRRP